MKIEKFRKIEIFQNMFSTRFRPRGTFLSKKNFWKFFFHYGWLDLEFFAVGVFALYRARSGAKCPYLTS